jgi:outer membrane protein W
MHHKLLACLAVAALASPLAFAQERYDERNVNVWGPEKGDWEVQLGAGGSNDADFENGGFNVDGTLGYYVTDNLEVALRQSVSYNDTGGESSWNGTTRAAVDYHFPLLDNRLRPFIGANLGYVYGDTVDDTWAAGPEAGAKFYVKDETFLFGRAEYQFLFDDGDDLEDEFSDGQWIYTVGIGFNF